MLYSSLFGHSRVPARAPVKSFYFVKTKKIWNSTSFACAPLVPLVKHRIRYKIYFPAFRLRTRIYSNCTIFDFLTPNFALIVQGLAIPTLVRSRPSMHRRKCKRCVYPKARIIILHPTQVWAWEWARTRVADCDNCPPFKYLRPADQFSNMLSSLKLDSGVQHLTCDVDSLQWCVSLGTENEVPESWPFHTIFSTANRWAWWWRLLLRIL